MVINHLVRWCFLLFHLLSLLRHFFLSNLVDQSFHIRH
jgi:hypothetical protein